MQVSNTTAVYVRRPGNAKKFKAEVVCDGKMADLALLTVKEDTFWTGLRGLEFVDVPELQSPIAVVGYPVGGDNISITKGIVSRVTLARYSPAARLLSIQIDAAINPGAARRGMPVACRPWPCSHAGRTQAAC